MDELGIDQPIWRELTSIESVINLVENGEDPNFTYPLIIRPSYVLSGAAMNIAYNKEDLLVRFISYCFF